MTTSRSRRIACTRVYQPYDLIFWETNAVKLTGHVNVYGLQRAQAFSCDNVFVSISHILRMGVICMGLPPTGQQEKAPSMIGDHHSAHYSDSYQDSSIMGGAPDSHLAPPVKDRPKNTQTWHTHSSECGFGLNHKIHF
jgi:hypothetical protein